MTNSIYSPREVLSITPPPLYRGRRLSLRVPPWVNMAVYFYIRVVFWSSKSSQQTVWLKNIRKKFAKIKKRKRVTQTKISVWQGRLHMDKLCPQRPNKTRRSHKDHFRIDKSHQHFLTNYSSYLEMLLEILRIDPCISTIAHVLFAFGQGSLYSGDQQTKTTIKQKAHPNGKHLKFSSTCLNHRSIDFVH